MRAIVLVLAALSLPTFADTFGGFFFHSSVPKAQSDYLSADLKYLYKKAYPVTDKEFAGLTKLETVDGPHLYNWLLNRVKYVVGESFEYEKHVLAFSGFKYPNTPLPPRAKPTPRPAPQPAAEPVPVSEAPAPTAPAPTAPTPNAPAPSPSAQPIPTPGPKTVMSNLGTGLYLLGKEMNTLIGVQFDDREVLLSSPRTGLLKVGEGLFYVRPGSQNNLASEANTINRLGTLFHEARHSDGNGESTGFTHDYCPVGHSYAGFAGCEASGNGSYTVGAASIRQMIKSCETCTPRQRVSLELEALDSFSRLIRIDDLGKIRELKQVKQTLLNIIEVYQTLDSVKARADIEGMKNQIAKIELEIEALILANNFQNGIQVPALNDEPEGHWKPVPLEDSSDIMESLIRE